LRHLAHLRLGGAILLAMLVLTQGCGSGSASTGTTGGSIALSLSPTSATIQVGGSTQVSGTIVRTDFTGDVAVTVSGAPSGVTGVANSQPTGGSNSASVTISAASTAAPGTYTLTVTASGSGISAA
jgi:hypothetical protein